jgi:methyl-accepting chemotaxis protein
MKVGTKLIAGFVFVSILGAVVACIGIINMSNINDQADSMYLEDLMGLSYIKEANINLIYAGRSRNSFLLSSSAEERAGHRRDIDKYLATIDDYLRKARPLFVLPQGIKMLDDYAASARDYRQLLMRALDRAAAEPLAQRDAELNQMLVAARKQADVLDDMLTAMTKLKEARAKQKSDDTTALFESSQAMMIGLVLGSLCAGLGIGGLVARSLTRQLGGEPAYAADVAGKIADGDLTVDVALRHNDHDSVLFAMKTMRDSLGGIVGEVRAGTDMIATASSQIASGTQDLSARTEQQAGALEETASSMEELTSTVKQNADHARRANHLALSASDVAQKGGAVVDEVIGTMGAINESSGKIADIIGVIDGIAFQTNILALNAAVEAARAGEQGRGFAVVASEVRNLAQRSAAAAKEIKQLIDDSVSKVDAGAKQVDQAGLTMREIVASIQRVTDIMADIQAASSEQTTGIEQINEAIVQMDQVTQQNAALVEQSAAASESMQDQARRLSQAVSVFKLEQRHVAPAAPAVSASRPRPVFAKPSARPVKAPLHVTDAGKNKVAASTATSDWEEF